tara:strand:- start:352 stop:729 length:378 start_codon:yes stop_codon:yes gene_type:complete
MYTLCAEFDWSRPLTGEKWENCIGMKDLPIYVDIQSNDSLEYLKEVMFSHIKMKTTLFLSGFVGHLMDEEPIESGCIYTIKNLKIYNETDQRDRHIYSVMLDVIWDDNKLSLLHREKGEVGYYED